MISTGSMIAAAAINGLDRAPDDRQRDPHQNTRSGPRTQPDLSPSPDRTQDRLRPEGLPGGPAPSATGGSARQAAPTAP